MSTSKTFAGQRGNAARSDCYVEIDWRAQHGRDIVIQSKVNSMYGTSLRKLMSTLCAHFGIDLNSVLLDDKGALPFVIAARFETAVRRKGTDAKEFLPSSKKRSLPSPKDRQRRTRLYLPGNEPKFFLNAALHAPDSLILDLEDSVPLEEKDAARILVRNALSVLDFKECEVSVRINQGEVGIEDLNAVAPHNVHTIYVPKVESPRQIHLVAVTLDEVDKKNGNKWRTLIIPIIESALGVVKAYEIASSSDRICALAIGLEDYTADLGVQRTFEGKESLFARSTIVNAARAAGIQPLDSVFSDVSAMDELRRSCAESRALGFEGKGCIHPRQIRIVHEAFLPTVEEIEKAAAIVVAFENARSQGRGVVAVGSKMIDAPVVKRALRVIESAVSSGMLNKNWRREGLSKK